MFSFKTSIGIIFSILMLISFKSNAAPSDHFVIQVNTKLGVALGNPLNQFTIPTSGIGYNYRVDWNNDGTFTDINISGDIAHNYPSGAPFIHTIRIAGDFPKIALNEISYNEHEKLISIDQWGTYPWTSMFGAFQNASNLVNNANDTPNLTSCNLLNHMFDSATKIGQGNANWDWDTSNVSQMNSMFENANSFDEDLSFWSFDSISTMHDMFLGITLSKSNYEALLESMNIQGANLNGVIFSGGDSQYCSAEGRNDHQNLEFFHNFIITDGGLCEEGYFITTWKSNNTGPSNNLSITIPTDPSQTFYNYQVDWNGDGDFDDTDEDINYNGDATHDYGAMNPPGVTRTVKIKGHFPAIYFNDSGDKEKILSIEQWGTNPWLTMRKAFRGASNITMNALDEPDLSSVVTMFSMFENGSNLGNSIGTWIWDTSNITGMANVFTNAVGFDEDLSVWDVSNVSNMGAMFSGVTLSTVNYDAILNGWAQLPLQSNVFFGAGNSIYCAAATARQIIIDTKNWSISDGNECITNQPPLITTGSIIYLPENNATVVTVEATDPEGGNIEFTFVGTLDTGLFNLDINTGELSFIVAPDFESPNSSAGTNSYNVAIKATDDGSPSESYTLLFTINVIDVNEDELIFENGFED